MILHSLYKSNLSHTVFWATLGFYLDPKNNVFQGLVFFYIFVIIFASLFEQVFKEFSS